jgi:Family of unknown function (DUF6263)
VNQSSCCLVARSNYKPMRPMISRLVTIALLAFSVMALPRPLAGQMLLRWKLKPGQSLAVVTKQQTESQVAFSGKSATTKIDIDLALEWVVTAADESQITLKQTIERAAVKLSTPQNAVIEFDSSATARPPGQARDLAEAIRSLVGSRVEIKMDTRGNILDVSPASDAAKALLAADDKAARAGSSSRGTIQHLLRRPLIILPEKAVAKDEEWTAASDLQTAAGAFKQLTTYRLAGTTEKAGMQVQSIEMTTKLDPQATGSNASSSGQIAIKTQKQTGTILFSADQGRVVEAEQTQQLVTERPYRDTTIVVTLSSTQKTTVKPTE